MIANDAEPESFHFIISGDNYSFGIDKKNMYNSELKKIRILKEGEYTKLKKYKKELRYCKKVKLGQIDKWQRLLLGLH